MSQTDYRTSLQYIEKFYQKHQIASDEKEEDGEVVQKEAESAPIVAPFKNPDIEAEVIQGSQEGPQKVDQGKAH